MRAKKWEGKNKTRKRVASEQSSGDSEPPTHQPTNAIGFVCVRQAFMSGSMFPAPSPPLATLSSPCQLPISAN